MDPVIVIPAVAIACLAIGAYGMHKLSASTSVPKAEQNALDELTAGVNRLLDTSGEQADIQAAQGRMASKEAVRAHLAALLTPKP